MMTNKNKLPSKISCLITCSGEPAEGLMLVAILGVEKKNAYSIVFGPTNNIGVAEITKDCILSDANKQLEFAMMDYEPLERCFTGEISVSFMNANEIKTALEAYSRFYKYYSYSANYEKNLKLSLESITKIDDRKKEIDTQFVN